MAPQTLWPWQQECVDILKQQPDRYTIYCYYGARALGRDVLSDYAAAHCGALSIRCEDVYNE